MECHKIITSLIYGGTTFLILLLCGGKSNCWAGDNNVQLIKDGKAQCVIVIGNERSASLVHSVKRSMNTLSYPSNVLPEAAADLAYYLNEIAQINNDNFQVKVVKSATEWRKKYRILLGSVAINKYNLEKEAKSLSYPAYIYRIVGNDLLIFGSSPKGTANGIYGFLQSELGIRWFGPQRLFHVIPRHQNITIENISKKVSPSFPGRWFGVATRKEHPAYHWSARYMRMNETVDNEEPFINASHNLYTIYPPKIYAKKHPEYYPLRNGKRVKPSTKHYSWTPCLTNSEVVKIAIEKAKNAFRNNEKQKSFSLGINDTNVFCQCPECKKHNKTINFRGSTDWESNVYYRFVNQVAKAVREEFPDHYIGCIAYNNVTPPPNFPLDKNVFVVITSDLSEYFDQSYRKGEEELAQAWAHKCKNLGLYYYEGLAKLVPAYFPHLVDKELKDKYKKGFKSLICEVAPGWPWNGPMAYVTAQLWWNINLDVDTLLDEYFNKLYGSAAEPMKRLYALFEQIHMRPRSGGFLYEHYKLSQFRPYNAEDLHNIHKYLAQAHNLAVEKKGNYEPPEDDIAQRVAYVSKGLRVFTSMLEAYVKAKEFGQTSKFDNIAALVRLNEIDRVNSILVEHDILYRETIRGDKFQSSRYTWDRCIPLRHEWKNFVLAGISKTLADLYRCNEKLKFNSRVRKRLEQILEKFNADPCFKSMFLLQTKQAELGPNLISNPGFEKNTVNGKYPQGPEWVPAQATNWALWPGKNKAGFSINKVKGHGDNALCISGIPNGSYITTINNINPGDSYHVSAYAKCLPPKQGETKSTVELSVQWLGSNNKWLKYNNNVFSDRLHEVNEWKKLETIAKVPKGAIKAVVLLSATLPSGEKVFFDNITFQKIGKSKLKLGPDLLDNGGFEQVWGVPPYQKCPTEKNGFPYAWYASPKGTHRGIMDTTKREFRSGKRSARVKGTVKSVYFLKPSKTFAKTPGIYLCEAWAKQKSKSSNTKVYMEIRWYDRKGWMNKDHFKVAFKDSESWSKAEIIARPPKGATSLAVFLITENLGSNDEIFFDDISVRRIIENQ